MKRRAQAAVAAVLLALAVGACSGEDFEPIQVVPGGDADVGKALIARFGCGSCHEIPGVKGADGLVGPPLTKFGRRQFIAGRLANTPENLIRWVINPKAVDPETAMPFQAISPDEARDIATYLEQLG